MARCWWLTVSSSTRSWPMGRFAESVRRRLAADPDHAAPHVVDVEVVSVIRRHHQLGRLDDTAAAQAVEDLREWPGERFWTPTPPRSGVGSQGDGPLLGRHVCRRAPRPWAPRCLRSMAASRPRLAPAASSTLFPEDIRGHSTSRRPPESPRPRTSRRWPCRPDRQERLPAPDDTSNLYTVTTRPDRPYPWIACSG